MPQVIQETDLSATLERFVKEQKEITVFSGDLSITLIGKLKKDTFLYYLSIPNGNCEFALDKVDMIVDSEYPQIHLK